MVTSVNEGMYTEMDSAGTPIQGIRDTNDFIHSGIIKGLSAGIRGHYAIKNGAYNGSVGFEIVQGNSGGKTTLAVAAGKVFRDGAYNSVATVTFTANSSPSTFDEPSSGTSYFMIVADASNALKIRGDKANTNSLPVNKHTSSSATDILTGDVPIAIVKMANGGTVDARPIQFLTTDQDEKTVTIGHTTTNAFVEAMSISSTASVTTFENKVTDADIVFKVSDNGVSTEALRIDGATARVCLGGDFGSQAMLHLRSSTSQEPEIRIENTNADTQEGQIRFMKNTASPASSDDIGIIRFEGENDAGTNHLYAYLMSDMVAVENNDEAGRMLFYVSNEGATVEVLRMTGGYTTDGGTNIQTEVVINDSHRDDVDFRVESDAYNMIHVDASNDSISLGGNDSAKIGFYAATPIVTPVLDAATMGAGESGAENAAKITEIANALVSLGLCNIA